MKSVLGVKGKTTRPLYEAEPGKTRCAECRGVDGHYSGCRSSKPGDTIIIRDSELRRWPGP